MPEGEERQSNHHKPLINRKCTQTERTKPGNAFVALLDNKTSHASPLPPIKLISQLENNCYFSGPREISPPVMTMPAAEVKVFIASVKVITTALVVTCARAVVG